MSTPTAEKEGQNERTDGDIDMFQSKVVGVKVQPECVGRLYIVVLLVARGRLLVVES